MDNYVITYFDNEKAFVETFNELRKDSVHIIDTFTPYHIPEANIDPKGKFPIPGWALSGALTGLILSLSLLFYTSFDYKMNTGGKEFFSWLTSVPVVFEVTILLSVLFAFTAFMIYRLPKWHYDYCEIEKINEAVDSEFVILIPLNQDEKGLIVEKLDRINPGKNIIITNSGSNT